MVVRRLGIFLKLLFEVVFRRLGKEKYLFKVISETVSHALWHTRWFIPDDLVAENPATQYHFVCKLVGDIAKGFSSDFMILFPHLHFHQTFGVFGFLIVFRILISVVFVRFAIRIAEIDKHCPGSLQHPTALVEYQAKMFDEVVPRGFEPQLPYPATAVFAEAISVEDMGATRIATHSVGAMP